MGHSIPTPPTEEHGLKPSRKTSSSKAGKASHRASKRIGGTSIISAATNQSEPHSPTSDGRHKRVWKACERCRMKKTKCDGEFPCKRCKDDGLICTAGVRKKVEYKQLPRGYAEVLESTQFSLIATIHKLYSMVQNGEKWDLGEPELNDRGQPIVHNIATKLGCIRPNSDVDLPVHSVFPEDPADLRDLARQLEAQQQSEAPSSQPATAAATGTASPASNGTDPGSASEHEHEQSDLESDRHATPATSHAFLSPQSPAAAYNPGDFDSAGNNPPDGNVMFHDHPTLASFAGSWGGPPPAMGMAPDFLSQPTMTNDMLTQGLLESEFGRLRPHMVSCPNPEVMMGMGDPMIYSGFGDDDGQQLRL